MVAVLMLRTDVVVVGRSGRRRPKGLERGEIPHININIKTVVNRVFKYYEGTK